MMFYTKKMSLCLFLILVFCFTTTSYSQVYKKIQSDKGDLDKYCIVPSDGKYDINFAVDLSNIIEQPEENQDIDLPCDLHVGVYIEESGQSFYLPVTDMQTGDSNTSFSEDERNDPRIGSFTITGQVDTLIPCEERRLTLNLNLYCKVGEEYIVYDECPEEHREVNEHGPLKALSPDKCDYSGVLEYKFCCHEDDSSVNRIRNMNTDLVISSKTLNNINLKGDFSGDEDIEVSIYNMSGQKLTGTKWTKIDDDLITIENTNLNFGLYFISVHSKNKIQTIKFLHK